MSFTYRYKSLYAGAILRGLEGPEPQGNFPFPHSFRKKGLFEVGVNSWLEAIEIKRKYRTLTNTNRL